MRTAAPQTKPDYLPFVQALADRLNADAMYAMSLTDVVKICVERAMQNYAPDVKIARLLASNLAREYEHDHGHLPLWLSDYLNIERCSQR